MLNKKRKETRDLKTKLISRTNLFSLVVTLLDFKNRSPNHTPTRCTCHLPLSPNSIPRVKHHLQNWRMASRSHQPPLGPERFYYRAGHVKMPPLSPLCNALNYSRPDEINVSNTSSNSGNERTKVGKGVGESERERHARGYHGLLRDETTPRRPVKFNWRPGSSSPPRWNFDEAIYLLDRCWRIWVRFPYLALPV